MSPKKYFKYWGKNALILMYKIMGQQQKVKFMGLTEDKCMIT
jgi:hypothetical protein